MGKTIMGAAAVSLDGFIADDNDEVGPLFDWLGTGDVSWSLPGSDDEARSTRVSADFMTSHYGNIAWRCRRPRSSGSARRSRRTARPVICRPASMTSTSASTTPRPHSADVEIHADVEALQGFFTMFREAAENWDGSDPIRPAVS